MEEVVTSLKQIKAHRLDQSDYKKGEAHTEWALSDISNRLESINKLGSEKQTEPMKVIVQRILKDPTRPMKDSKGSFGGVASVCRWKSHRCRSECPRGFRTVGLQIPTSPPSAFPKAKFAIPTKTCHCELMLTTMEELRKKWGKPRKQSSLWQTDVGFGYPNRRNWPV